MFGKTGSDSNFCRHSSAAGLVVEQSGAGVTLGAFEAGMRQLRDQGFQLDDLAPIGAPVQLLAPDDDRRLRVCEPALEQLRALDGPIRVIAVAGTYRSGKSYLMNLLFDRPAGFELGAGVQGVTRGIWMWTRPSSQPGEPNTILLDTEGLHDPANPDADYDARLLSMAILLSSLLLINVKGTLDTATMQNLACVSKLSSLIKTKYNETEDEAGSDFVRLFPELTFVVRDAALQLAAGQTNDDYLNAALEDVPNRNPAAFAANQTRTLIRHYFSKRKVVRLVVPTLRGEQALGEMQSIALDDVRLEFTAAVAQLKLDLERRPLNKTFDGVELSGAQFANLLPRIVEG